MENRDLVLASPQLVLGYEPAELTRDLVAEIGDRVGEIRLLRDGERDRVRLHPRRRRLHGVHSHGRGMLSEAVSKLVRWG